MKIGNRVSAVPQSRTQLVCLQSAQRISRNIHIHKLLGHALPACLATLIFTVILTGPAFQKAAQCTRTSELVSLLLLPLSATHPPLRWVWSSRPAICVSVPLHFLLAIANISLPKD